MTNTNTDRTYTVDVTVDAEEATVKTDTAIEQNACVGGISLKTALRILETIQKNAHESVGFWAAKTAYSGVYRTAVKNGWIEDGVFVTDIPEGVDGGFLAADMRRISLMAKLLADVLSDRLDEEPTVSADSPALHDIINHAVEEHVRALLSEAAIGSQIAEAFDEALEELDSHKEDVLEDIRSVFDELKVDFLSEMEDAKNN